MTIYAQNEFMETNTPVVVNGTIFLAENTAAAFGNKIVNIEENQVSRHKFDLAKNQFSQNGDPLPLGTVKTEENLCECHHLRGRAKYPGTIVETPGLANIKPPRPIYRPQLLKELIESGQISEIQLERIICAGQAPAQLLACDGSTTRRNFHRRRNGCPKNYNAFGHYSRQLVLRQKTLRLVQR